jgi:hypothetical protein
VAFGVLALRSLQQAVIDAEATAHIGAGSPRGRLPGQPQSGRYVRSGAEDTAGPAVWRGLPSGEVFADLVRERADGSGVTAHVDVTAWELQGAYGVSVDWQSGDAMYEVADWVDGARVLDSGDDLSLDHSFDYQAARVSGLLLEEAVRQVAPPARSRWASLRRRRR